MNLGSTLMESGFFFADHKCSFRLIRNAHLLLTKLFYFSNTSNILHLIRKKTKIPQQNLYSSSFNKLF